jgi:hypothetical protein
LPETLKFFWQSKARICAAFFSTGWLDFLFAAIDVLRYRVE